MRKFHSTLVKTAVKETRIYPKVKMGGISAVSAKVIEGPYGSVEGRNLQHTFLNISFHEKSVVPLELSRCSCMESDCNGVFAVLDCEESVDRNTPGLVGGKIALQLVAASAQRRPMTLPVSLCVFREGQAWRVLGNGDSHHEQAQSESDQEVPFMEQQQALYVAAWDGEGRV